jgi:hypothetical protein
MNHHNEGRIGKQLPVIDHFDLFPSVAPKKYSGGAVGIHVQFIMGNHYKP